MSIRIALTGKMRSGKDTVAEYLIKEYNFKRFAFGDGIREACNKYFPQIIAKGKPRFLYQGVGQDFRKYDVDVWVKWIFREIADNTTWHDNVVITDLRQPNELEELIRKGFYIVKVNASLETCLARMYANGDNFNPADLEHETEQHIDGFTVNFEIDNNGDHTSLLQQVEQMLFIIATEGEYDLGEGVQKVGKREN